MSDLTTLRRLDALERLDRDRRANEPASSGAAFPSSPSAGLRWFRSDLGWECYYDGTRWLTAWEFPLAFAAGGNTYATNYSATTASVRYASTRNDFKLWLTYAVMTISTGATNSGASYITYNFVDSNAATVWSVSTAADSTNATVTKAASSFTQPSAVATFVRLDIAVTGAPSAQFCYTPVMYARLVVT